MLARVRRRLRDGPLVVLLLGLPLAGTAQAPEEELRDEEPVGEIVVRGVRPGALPRVPTASSDIVETDDFEAENKTLAELLDGLSGVRVRRFGGRGEAAELSIRGSTANQVVLTLDGVPVNNALTGLADPNDYCLPQVERVAVTRGAGSSQVGSGAIGGVIDLTTRSTSDAPTTAVTFSGGAFDTYEGSIRHARPLGELGLQLGYCGLTTEGDFEFARPTQVVAGIPIEFEPDVATRLNNDRVRHGGNLALSHPLGIGELRLRSLFSYVDGGAPGIDSGNGPTAGQALEARRRNWSALTIADWEGVGFLEDTPLLRAHHRFEELRFENPMPALGAPIDTRARVQTYGVQARDEWEPRVLGNAQHFRIFADGTRDELRDADQRNRQRNRGGVGTESTLRALKERVVLSASVRLDGADGFRRAWLPSGGLAVTPVPWLRLRGNVSRAYRVPNFNELFLPDQGFIRGNPNLEPEDAINADVGAEFLLEALGPLRRVRLRAALFRREIEESIVWVLVSPFTVAPINTGDATVEGIELSGSVSLSRFLTVSAQHTHIDSERDETGKELPGQPEFETFGRVEVGFPDVVKLVGEVQDTGEILVNEGGGRRLPARTVWNASVSLNLAAWSPLQRFTRARSLWVFFEIDNIGDVAVRDSLSFPQPGRNASAGFEARW
ncbi:MAG: TonB-dependent receptor [Myxococcota bacterium]